MRLNDQEKSIIYFQLLPQMLNRPKLRSTQPLLSRGKNQADAAIVPLIIRQIPERRLAPALEDGLLQAGQMDFRLG
jgi:hypothetical protein